MSSPIEAFATLNLSPEMQQADVPPRVVAESKIRYNIGNLPQNARIRARDGLENTTDISIDYCKEMGEGGGQYFVFSVRDHITVRIGGPFPVPLCSCGANENGIACKHIFWLEDQLVQALGERPPEPQLRTDGSKIQGTPVTQLLTGAGGLEWLAERQRWNVRQQNTEDEDDVKDQLNELLSVFEPSGALPSEFIEDSFGQGPDRRLDSSLVYKKFSNLVNAYALHDFAFRRRLESVITPEFSAIVFFKRMNERVRLTFDALEAYKKYGPSSTDLAYNVATCADKLEELVENIKDWYEERVPGTGESAAVHAAGVLVDILRAVVSSNENAYGNITWTRPESQNETAQDNNLYVRLIGDPVDKDQTFLLPALRVIPENVRRTRLETLTIIVEKLERYNPRPEVYIRRLRSIIPA